MDTVFTDVSCGGAHTAAVAEDGSAFLWGLNDSGQLAQGDESPYLQVPLLACMCHPMAAGMPVQSSTEHEYHSLHYVMLPSMLHVILRQSSIDLAHAGPTGSTCARGHHTGVLCCF